MCDVISAKAGTSVTLFRLGNQAELSCMCKCTSVKHAIWARNKVTTAICIKRNLLLQSAIHHVCRSRYWNGWWSTKFGGSSKHNISVMARLTLLPPLQSFYRESMVDAKPSSWGHAQSFWLPKQDVKRHHSEDRLINLKHKHPFMWGQVH